MKKIITEDFKELSLPDDLYEVELNYDYDTADGKVETESLTIYPDEKDLAEFLREAVENVSQQDIDNLDQEEFVNFLYTKHLNDAGKIAGSETDSYFDEEFNLIERKKDKKHRAKVTYTTGSPFLNVHHFNKCAGTSTPEEDKEAIKVAAEFTGAISGDGEANTSSDASSSSDGGEGSGNNSDGLGEALESSGGVHVGDTIEIISMSDPYVDYAGKKGKVEHIDDLGQIHGSWGGCALIPGVDKFKIIANENLIEMMVDRYEYFKNKIKETAKDLVETTQKQLDLSNSKAEDYAILSVFWSKLLDIAGKK